MTPNTDQWRAPDCDWGHPGDPDWELELELEQQQRPPATTGEAVSEWARHCGSDPHRIGQQWLLTEYYTIVRNPHYTGPAQRHPDEPEDYALDSVVAPAAGHTVHADDRSQLVTPGQVPGLEVQPLDDRPV